MSTVWRVADVVDARDETPTARTIRLRIPGLTGHLPGQHVDVRLTAPDGYQAVRSYSIASASGAGGLAADELELTVEELKDASVPADDCREIAESICLGDDVDGLQRQAIVGASHERGQLGTAGDPPGGSRGEENAHEKRHSRKANPHVRSASPSIRDRDSSSRVSRHMQD